MNWNWQAIIKYFPDLLSASITTLELVIASCALGLIFGVLLGLWRLSPVVWLRAIPAMYIFFFRGTPLLVQIFLIYYGLGQFDAIKQSALWQPVLSQAYWCAIIAFTLNTSAYIAEIVRGAIQAVPQGELEAADAIGMSKLKKLRRITLPRAFGIMIPAYSNEVIFMLKGSALAASITVAELTYKAREIMAATYLNLEMYFAAGVIYLLISWVFLFAFRQFEHRINRHKYYTPTHQS
ncbi:amino acid ABC transporter membrane protein 2, PAAT family [Moraxella cuniculi DSM 21768]|uniref:Arginine ABC transporter permease protein ArtM n=1 Tax=Moraxella cuniculi DSM 21768 TaxID=1122245 RepID=A0A1N7ECH5_9GAMM|nr:ABC transporter permease [Moraxella cuniculi]OOS05360.1 ABC transporter permease [Moraxella cuniculi]SIR85678.1 amino acid ABC transporter membrane protein 2, PAAT family [Moraxella cuniculi DSM 21768]